MRDIFEIFCGCYRVAVAWVVLLTSGGGLEDAAEAADVANTCFCRNSKTISSQQAGVPDPLSPHIEQHNHMQFIDID